MAAAAKQPEAKGVMGGVLAGGELVIPLTFVVVVIVMIIPLPTVMLDLLLTVNIAVSLIILLVAMYTLKPLEFSTFPSVLLVTTRGFRDTTIPRSCRIARRRRSRRRREPA